MTDLYKKVKVNNNFSLRYLLKLPYTEKMFTAFALAIIVGYVLQGFPDVVNDVFRPLSSIVLILLKI